MKKMPFVLFALTPLALLLPGLVPSSKATKATPFAIFINRTANIGDSLITGDIYLNQEYLGKTYENKGKLIGAGRYDGAIRYWSDKFAQGPFGTLGKSGDFLLEVKKAKSADGAPRTNILLHTGMLPSHSTGCILLGPASGPKGTRYITDDHVLRKLRLKFYGTEFPNSSPDKEITIEIQDRY